MSVTVSPPLNTATAETAPGNAVLAWVVSSAGPALPSDVTNRVPSGTETGAVAFSAAVTPRTAVAEVAGRECTPDSSSWLSARRRGIRLSRWVTAAARVPWTRSSAIPASAVLRSVHSGT